jgi:hypothetical protein
LELSLIAVTAISTAAAMPFSKIMGFAPAQRFSAPREPWTVQQRGGCGAVAKTSLRFVKAKRISGAPMFSKGSEAQFLCNGYAVVCDQGNTKLLLSELRCSPCTPRLPYGICKLVTPESREARTSSPYLMSLAI